MLLIAGEPTTALDVTIQAQIPDLIRGLQERTRMAVVFITHNLGVIAQIADTVAIMYRGRVVEYGPVREILRNPRHPYTANLLRAEPRLGKTMSQRLVAIEGNIPGPFERPSGCPLQGWSDWRTDSYTSVTKLLRKIFSYGIVRRCSSLWRVV